jgi:hypothetical protein
MTTTIPDMIRRHRELYALTDRLYAAGSDAATDTPEYVAAIEETIDLEHRIVATRATGVADLLAKREFIAATEFINEGTPGLSTGDLARLVEAILQLDADGIAA